jgi:hypothetical protein
LPTKEQTPARSQKIQGVVIDVSSDGITVRPDPDRVQKLVNEIQKILREGSLEPDSAARLAGKLSFVSTTLFGRIGKGPLSPLYKRAHQQGESAITPVLLRSLRTLTRILQLSQPKFCPFPSNKPYVATIYADAFFQAGDDAKMGKRRAPGDLSNGWGFICRTEHGVTYAHGRAPDSLVRCFCRSHAYIYFLELLGQVLSLVVNRRFLPHYIIAFCDNAAGTAALSKGFSTSGSDQAVNNLLAMCWSFLARMGWNVHFEWIPSEQNIADPVSRGDLSFASQSRWRSLNTRLTEVYAVLERVSRDLEFATGEAVEALAGMSFSFSES